MANTYVLSLTNGTPDITVNENETVVDHGLTFTGRGVAEYGEHRNTNILHIAENFAGDTAPTSPLTGQTWFNTTTNEIEVWDGAAWISSTALDDYMISGTYNVSDITNSVSIPKALTADIVLNNIATFTNLQAHIVDATSVHAASAVSFDDTLLPYVAVTLQEAVVDTQNELTVHINDATAAHAATAISFVPYTSISSTTVQAAMQELEQEINSLDSNITVAQALITNHINDTFDAHDATAISYNNGVSGLVATNVQAAIDEIEFNIESGV